MALLVYLHQSISACSWLFCTVNTLNLYCLNWACWYHQFLSLRFQRINFNSGHLPNKVSGMNTIPNPSCKDWTSYFLVCGQWYIHIHICVFVCVYIHKYMYVYTSVYMCVCIYIDIYIYTHICLHICKYTITYNSFKYLAATENPRALFCFLFSKL